MEFSVRTNEREEIINITSQVEKVVEREGKNGKACLVFPLHTTCSIFINEKADVAVGRDILKFLRENIKRDRWEHDCEEHNADSHIKAILTGNSQLIPIEQGKLQFGTWQGIFLAEFDGPRERKIVVKIL